jgi:hypothetical protein
MHGMIQSAEVRKRLIAGKKLLTEEILEVCREEHPWPQAHAE